MKQWGMRLFFLMVALASCLQMFVLKYKVIEKEDELKALHKQIIEDSRAIHLLEAEWAAQNNPDRLLELVQTTTNLKPISSEQVQRTDMLPIKMIQPPSLKPDIESVEEEV